MAQRIMISLALVACWLGVARTTRSEEPQVAHMVFFELVEKSKANQEKLVAACDKYLAGHPGTVYYSAGGRAEDLKRDVNDTGFDVALHVVFKNKAAHDKYQTDKRHLQFIEENKELWSGVRVFDSYVIPPKQKRQETEAAAAGKEGPAKDRPKSFQGKKVKLER